MDAPLLRNTDEGGARPRLLARLAWALCPGWWEGDTPTDGGNAATVQLLQKVMIDLGMLMDHAEEEYTSKMEQAAAEHRRGRREMALKAVQTAHSYGRRRAVWFGMRENVEQIKAELISQQQTASVFGAFSQANAALARLAEQLDVTGLESVLESLREKFEQGEDVSALLGDPGQLEACYDAGQAERDLLDFVASADQPAEKSAAKIGRPRDKIKNPTEGFRSNQASLASF